MKRTGWIVALGLITSVNLWASDAGKPQEQGVSVQQGQENVLFRWGFGALIGKKAEFVAVTRDTSLASGEEIKLVVELRKDCYVYVVHQSSSGEIALLFPYSLKQFASDYKPEKNYYIPKGRDWFRLDTLKGRETFYLLDSSERLLDLEARLANYQSATPAKKGQLADEVVGEIRNVRKRYRTLAAFAERPVAIGGNIRGMEKLDETKRPDVSAIATEVSAQNFYAKTITIDHR